ncbi:MAG: MazG nucleotide pyrophosphohydrolase domain-containing protein [Planctomycetota bacterium]
MQIREFQDLIERTYFEKDSSRGLDGTFMWFVEEVGELARALKGDDRDNLIEEFSDVLAWLSSLASIKGIKMEEVAARYAEGCPKCHDIPCSCA